MHLKVNKNKAPRQQLESQSLYWCQFNDDGLNQRSGIKGETLRLRIEITDVQWNGAMQRTKPDYSPAEDLCKRY